MSDDSGQYVNSTEDSNPIQNLLAELQQLADHPRIVSNAEELEALERDIRQLSDRVGSLIVGQHLQHALESAVVQQEEAALVKAWPKPLRNDGKQTVMIRTAQGMSVAVRATYYRRKGRRRGHKRHPGVYAGLVVLGIHERCTPGLTSEISMLSAMLGSLEEARQVFLERGLEFDVKTLRTITYACARRARLVQQMETQRFEETVAGRRVVIGCDGGRIRLREAKRGKKSPKGRRRYRGAWREPKLLIIHVVDASGRRLKSFVPLMDATLKGPEALFKLLQSYLQRLDISQADQVLFVSDGAPWIWKRVAVLTRTLGLKGDQVYELIDFYHAVEHLAKVASLRKGWSSKQRKQWVARHRRWLLKGQVARVIEAVRNICRGRNSKAIRTQRDYFINNAARMAYAKIMALNLPIGSGAVESAIRRVVNLRLKGPGIFWCKDNAEAMLMLRAYYKAGRWDLLKHIANSPLSRLAS
ncbi:MAG: hypothetical protein ACE5HE_14320 [Phycisphaerae bacterium]